MKLLRTIAVTFALYSRIPMPHFEWRDEDMKYSMSVFPWVGAVIGLAYWAVFYFGVVLGLPMVAVCMLMTAVPLILTGGFHVGGFMDVSDALSSFKTREQKLEILKDPHIGECRPAGHMPGCGVLPGPCTECACCSHVQVSKE